VKTSLYAKAAYTADLLPMPVLMRHRNRFANFAAAITNDQFGEDAPRHTSKLIGENAPAGVARVTDASW
jgi:hypothetical protein